MMNEYYGSVDFDFSISFEDEGYFGVTIRPDTNYAETLSRSCENKTTKFLDMTIEIK
jgi:hypothetical protein